MLNRKETREERELHLHHLKIHLGDHNLQPLFTDEEFIQDEPNAEMKFKCLSCGRERSLLNNPDEDGGIYYKNFRCYCYDFRSFEDEEIADFLDSLGVYFSFKVNFMVNKDKHYPLDFFIPEFNLGIECQNLYAHCEVNKERNYHRDKYRFFKEQGINILQILETEWYNKQDIVKSIISTRLGKTTERIAARKCEVREMPYAEYAAFCEKNHIQGPGIAKTRIGLYHNNELVQLASFSKSRFNKHYDFEIIRSCTKTNTLVMGGFPRIFKFFKKLYPEASVITYADMRYFTGKSYQDAGFVETTSSAPNYYYFNIEELRLYHRSVFQKHKLKDKLEIFDENKTEHENMIINNYFRIFDSGNLVFVYEPTKQD